jgi:hypothetical protein
VPETWVPETWVPEPARAHSLGVESIPPALYTGGVGAAEPVLTVI